MTYNTTVFNSFVTNNEKLNVKLVSFYYFCSMKLKRIILSLVLGMALLCCLSSCMNQNYLMFEDDEWSGREMDGDRVLSNGELEMDDWDR